MSSQKLKLAVILMLAAIVTMAASKSQTFTGEVSDSMCGAKHMMGAKTDCLRACVRQGSNYALVVGGKVYTLHTANQAALEQLNRLAGEQAKVTGTADGDTIEVSQVTASK